VPRQLVLVVQAEKQFSKFLGVWQIEKPTFNGSQSFLSRFTPPSEQYPSAKSILMIPNCQAASMERKRSEG